MISEGSPNGGRLVVKRSLKGINLGEKSQMFVKFENFPPIIGLKRKILNNFVNWTIEKGKQLYYTYLN